MLSLCLRSRWIALALLISPAVAQRLPFHHYAIEDGLIQSTAMSLYQDRAGFLWIGTTAGVSRFDGLEFVNFNFEDGLANDVIRDIIQDRQGRIWLATEGGVSRFDDGTFVNFGRPEGVPHHSVRCVVEDRSGRLWFGTYGGGIVTFEEGRFIPVGDWDGADKLRVLAGFRAENGDLWFGGIDTGLVHVRDDVLTVHTQKQAPVFNSVRAILEHPDWGLLIGAERGLHVFDGESFNTLPEHGCLAECYVQALMLDSEQRLWAGTRENGVFRFEGPEVAHFTTLHGLSNNAVKRILEDRDGNIWLGTYGGGVCRLSHENFWVYTVKEGLPFENVYCIAQDRRGRMWFGTNDGGAIILEGTRKFTALTTRDWIATSKVLSLLVDRAGRVWVGTLKGVFRYDRGEVTELTRDTGLGHDIVYSIKETDDGRFWFGTYAGLTHHDGTAFKTFTTADGLPHNRINFVMMAGNGDVWLATGNGISRLRDGQFENWGPEDGLAGNFVLHLMEDTTGSLWICTTQGLSKFDQGTFHNFSRADGLSSSRCSVAVEGHDGSIWVGTNQGINMFDGTRFRSITVRDGISSDEVNRGAGFCDQNGALWFGTVRGITKFKPNAEFDPPAAPLVYLSHLKYLDQDIPMTDDLVLPHDKNHLTFEFLCTSFRAPKNVTYRYALEGLSDQWQDIRQRTVQFAALPPGDYTFELKARNGNGPWSPEPARFSFRIAPPVWLTWWAKSCYVLLAGLGVLGYVWSQSRIKQSLARRIAERTDALRKKNEEVLSTQRQLLTQEKMASLGTLTAGIAHEIKNPLNFVNNFAELSHEYLAELRDEVDKQPEPSVPSDKKRINEIFDQLERNCRLIRRHGTRANDIVQSMMSLVRGGETKTQEIELNAVVGQFADLAFHGKRADRRDVRIDMRKNLDPAVGRLQVMPADIGRVVINTVNNAVEALEEKCRTADAGFSPVIEVSTKRRENSVEIRITDNGPGIPGKRLEEVFNPFFTTKPVGTGNVGLGLSLSYDIIVNQHGGKISIASEPERQTQCVIELPIHAKSDEKRELNQE